MYTLQKRNSARVRHWLEAQGKDREGAPRLHFSKGHATLLLNPADVFVRCRRSERPEREEAWARQSERSARPV